MIKAFCDQCGKEITDKNAATGGSSKRRLCTSIGHLSVEVMTAQNGVSNAGDYCKYCILDALYKLDDRPGDGP